MSINRRQFVKQSTAVAALAATPLSLLANGGNSNNWQQAFREALESKPWLSAFSSVKQEQFESQAQVSGNWPAELKGVLYRNGPARHEIGDFRYQHFFDGDGMFHGYEMSANGVNHKAKMIQTRKYLAEKAAGRALYPGFATIPPNPAPVTSPDLVNVGNISVLPHHGKLLALWEAGSPWEIDPENMDTKGIYSFSPETQGVPFSAHPRIDADGALWNFGYVSSANLMVLWHIDKNGKVVKMGKIPSDPISMPHDFIVTSKHIVILMPPLNFETRGAKAFLDSHQWHPEQATRVLVVDKNDFSRYRWLELPSQWVFHFGNGWEDNAGVIRFDGARGNSPINMIDSFREVMRGNIVANAPSYHHQYQIDTKKWTVTEQRMFADNIHTEFPVIDPRVSCQHNRRVIMLSTNQDNLPVHPNLNEVSVFDYDSGKLKSFRYDDYHIPEEHLFVPKPGSALEAQGWVVGTAHNWKNQTTVLSVFDVEAIEAGPVASATFNYAMPMGLHGKFVAS